MTKILLTIVISILAFSSCYEDSKPTLTLNFNDFPNSRSVDGDFSVNFDNLDAIHVAVFYPSNLYVPVAYATIAKGVSSATLMVPAGQLKVVVWGTEAAIGINEKPVSWFDSQTIDTSNSSSNMTIDFWSVSFSQALNLTTNTGAATWNHIPGAFEYQLEKNIGTTLPVYIVVYLGKGTSYNDSGSFRLKIISSVFGISSDYYY